jgi:signal transduction histidine kinase
MSAAPEFAWNEPDPKAEWESAQRLLQAQKLEAVGRLAGAVAHDFNNLLTGVLLYCDLLIASLEAESQAENIVTLKHAESNRRMRTYAEEIRKAGLQGTGLVRQLLAVARPAQRESSLISLNETTGEMRELLTRLIGENIELKFEFDPALGLIKMDATEAQQILLNLVLNARDALPNGGQIAVETRSCKVQILSELKSGMDHATSLPCVLLVVTDNGDGMDAATREHLFEAFFTTKQAGKGTGLGLATVHDIVTRSGGLIHVESAPGRGTRMNILLPLVPPSLLPLVQPAASISQLYVNSLEGASPQQEKEKTP